jgi:hypothetical protein
MGSGKPTRPEKQRTYAVANTSFSISLQGLDLPNDVRGKIESTLRSVVLARIARTDLGAQLSVQPLPSTSERDFFRPGQILGFVIKNVAKLAERSVVMTGPSLLFTPPDHVKQAQALLASVARRQKRSAEAEQLEQIAELLEREPEARRAFSRLLEMPIGESTEDERDDSVWKYGPVLAPIVYGFRLGTKVGQSLVK